MMRVVLVDDHTVFLETLEAAVARTDDIEVVATAGSAEDGDRLCRELAPDVALIDLGLPDSDGIELAKRIKNSSPQTRVVVLTGSTDASLFPRAMAAGACGYLMKDARLAEVLDAIRTAASGHVVVPERVAVRLAQAQVPKRGLGSDLTARELDVLAMIASGADAKSIGTSLGITWHTARSYIKSILGKLAAHSQLEAVATATRLGIIEAAREPRVPRA